MYCLYSYAQVVYEFSLLKVIAMFTPFSDKFDLRKYEWTLSYTMATLTFKINKKENFFTYYLTCNSAYFYSTLVPNV